VTIEGKGAQVAGSEWPAGWDTPAVVKVVEHVDEMEKPTTRFTTGASALLSAREL
jgi:hypothetical protein